MCHERRDAPFRVGSGAERRDDERRLASAAVVGDVGRRNVTLIDALDTEPHGAALVARRSDRPRRGRQEDRIGGEGARRRVVEVGVASPRERALDVDEQAERHVAQAKTVHLPQRRRRRWSSGRAAHMARTDRQPNREHSYTDGWAAWYTGRMY